MPPSAAALHWSPIPLEQLQAFAVCVVDTTLPGAVGGVPSTKTQFCAYRQPTLSAKAFESKACQPSENQRAVKYAMRELALRMSPSRHSSSPLPLSERSSQAPSPSG